jgi:hypothetical protein
MGWQPTIHAATIGADTVCGARGRRIVSTYVAADVTCKRCLRAARPPASEGGERT